MQVDPHRFEKMEDLIKRFRGSNDKRVKIAHGLWVVTVHGGRLHHVSRQKLQASSYFDEPGGAAIARLADYASKLWFEWGITLLERVDG
jgi:hypothetical protein